MSRPKFLIFAFLPLALVLSSRAFAQSESSITSPERAHESSATNPANESGLRDIASDFLSSIRSMILSRQEDSAWILKLRSDVAEIEKNSVGKFGLYVKDLTTGQSYGFNSDRFWYLASTVKLAVVIEVFRQAGAKRIDLTDEVTITKDIYRDGAGHTNWKRVGSKVTLLYLVEQMMVESDNAATDYLIGTVGIENVNKTLHTLVPEGFGEITSLLDVRRLAYSQLHPKALKLTNMDYFALKRTPPSKRYAKFASIIGVKPSTLKLKSVEEAYERYYTLDYNKATLKAYARLLELLATGQILSQAASETILDLMSRAATGKQRIVAGLDKSMQWSHKTGTQLGRVCDMGVATVFVQPLPQRVIITACVEHFKDHDAGEKILADLGRAVQESGVFITVPPGGGVEKE